MPKRRFPASTPGPFEEVDPALRPLGVDRKVPGNGNPNVVTAAADGYPVFLIDPN
ncbi:MAG: hypothetical protein M3067_00575 [Chloroflexota bacterium]|nr:hypothetical protein [Chloroflexota bacterium]